MTATRIASLLASGTEMLFGMGLGDQVVAVSHECDYPAAASTRPRVTRTHVAAEAPSGQIDQQVRAMLAGGAALYEIDVPRLTSLRPDLIVTQAQCDVCAVRYQDVLDLVGDRAELSGTAVVALNPMSLDDVFADIRQVGQAAGCPDRADNYVDSLRARVEAVRQRTAPLPLAARPRVTAIEWIEPLILGGNWMPELIEIAGGRCPLAVAGRHSEYIDWPAVREFDPQVVVIMPCGFDLRRTLEEAPALARLPDWADVAAVGGGRVFAVDGNAYFNRSGPRLVESLELLAHLLHPALFAPPADADGTWRAWESLH
jgi:iron complex transport system substrate-binding protein